MGIKEEMLKIEQDKLLAQEYEKKQEAERRLSAEKAWELNELKLTPALLEVQEKIIPISRTVNQFLDEAAEIYRNARKWHDAIKTEVGFCAFVPYSYTQTHVAGQWGLTTSTEHERKFTYFQKAEGGVGVPPIRYIDLPPDGLYNKIFPTYYVWKIEFLHQNSEQYLLFFTITTNIIVKGESIVRYKIETGQFEVYRSRVDMEQPESENHAYKCRVCNTTDELKNAIASDVLYYIQSTEKTG